MSFARVKYCRFGFLILAGAIILGAQVSVRLVPAGQSRICWEMTNNSGADFEFLAFDTPLSGMEADLFLVDREGKAAPYVDKLVLRVGPVGQDWIKLADGQSVQAELDMARHYLLSEPGNYTVTFTYPVGCRFPKKSYTENGFDIIKMESNPVEITGRGMNSNAEIDKDEPKSEFVNCDNEKQESLSNAYKKSEELASESLKKMAKNESYVTWFGEIADDRFKQVRQNLEAITRVHDGNWQCTCTFCLPGVVAYVYPQRPKKVWICHYFHRFDALEKGSMLLHEASHWSAAAGTKDHGYGTTRCKNLASQSPDRAIQNADNYRFYVLDQAK